MSRARRILRTGLTFASETGPGVPDPIVVSHISQVRQT